MPVVALQHGQKFPLSPVEMRLRFLRASPGPQEAIAPEGATRSNPMMDILMLALGFVFFALAIGYTYACERL